MWILKISLINLFILLWMSEAVEFGDDEDTLIIEAAANVDENSGPRQDKQFVGQFGLPSGWPFAILGVNYPVQQIQPRPPQQAPQQVQQLERPGPCKTSRGTDGKCATLRQCFPALRTNGDNETLLNPGLAEVLISASGPCQSIIPKYYPYSYHYTINHSPKEVDVKQSTSICCSSQQPQKSPPMLPKPTTTTARPARQNYRPPFFGHRPPVADTDSSPPSTEASFVPSNCGVGHITGGSETEPSKYPWVVALLNGQKQICGGSLIDNMHILTAAHCIAHMNPYDVAKLRVLLGAHNIYQVSSGTVVKKVSRVIKHRHFSHRTLHNDVAILKLDSAVSFTDRIRPICLATEQTNRYENQIATVAGWGSVGEHSPQPQTLRDVAINIWTNDQCRSKYGSLAPGGITDHMMCAGSHDRDACRGDSGGPLMIHADSVYKQIGIVSWGIGCGRFPGVYTRVAHFLDWIDKNRK